MPFVDRGGARLHWDAAGDGTPVLLIMGHLYSARMWHPLLPALTQRHRAISFDNRGVGQSSTSDKVTIGDFAEDALAVMDAAGVDRAHVYGVSMGGGIALEFALRHPDRVRSLILGCTMMKTPDKTRAPWYARLIYRLPHGVFRNMALSRLTPAAYGSAAPLEAAQRDMQVLSEESFTMRGIAAQSAAIAAYSTSREAVAALKMPTLVLHGDEDRAVDVKYGRELAATIPGSRLQVFPGAAHNYLVAAGPASTSAVLEFLAEVDAQPGAAAAQAS